MAVRSDRTTCFAVNPVCVLFPAPIEFGAVEKHGFMRCALAGGNSRFHGTCIKFAIAGAGDSSVPHIMDTLLSLATDVKWLPLMR